MFWKAILNLADVHFLQCKVHRQLPFSLFCLN